MRQFLTVWFFLAVLAHPAAALDPELTPAQQRNMADLVQLRSGVQLKSDTSGKADRFRELRDHAIRMLGWVAGNTYGTPLWPEVKQNIGRGGVYYNFFVRLRPPGLKKRTLEAEAIHNIRLYLEWFEKGQTRTYNEADNMNKLGRILQIGEEVIAVYR